MAAIVLSLKSATRGRSDAVPLAVCLLAYGSIALLTGCFADISPSDVTTTQAPDAGPEPDVDLPDVPVSSLPISPSEVSVNGTFLGSVALLLPVEPLHDGGLLAATGGQVFRLDERGEVAGHWPIESHPVTAMAAIDDDRALLLGADALWALDGGVVQPSPVADIVDPASIERLLSAGSPERPEVWLSTADHIVRWRGGELVEVNPGELPVESALTLFGAPLEGRSAMWVYSTSVLYALVERQRSWTATPQRDDIDVVAMAADRHDGLWLLDAGGDLHVRDVNGEWGWLRFPDPVVALAGHRLARDVWFASASAVWHYDDGVFTEVVEVLDPFETETALFESDGGGRLYLGSNEGVLRVSSGRPLLLGGLADGVQLVDESVLIEIFPSRPELVRDVTASLGDNDDVDVLQEPLRIELDAAQLEAGVYELSVTVSYRDDFDDVTASVLFTVGEVVVPTWTNDIDPINQEKCVSCHGPRGTAHLRHTARGWQAEIEDILDSTRTGRMPLSPDPVLPDHEIALIEGWVAGGFQE